MGKGDICAKIFDEREGAREREGKRGRERDVSTPRVYDGVVSESTKN